MACVWCTSTKADFLIALAKALLCSRLAVISYRQTIRLMKRNIVISGASSGIGLGIAKRFVEAGDTVFNLDVKAPEKKSIQNIESKEGGSVATAFNFIECDMRDHQQVTKAINDIAKKHTIDVVVSNAGIHYSASIEETTEEDFMSVFNLNVKGAYSMVKAALFSMKKQQKGVVLFVGSDQSIIGKPSSFAYNLSKHCLASMAKTTALDYAQFNIRANVLCPGTIETPLYHSAIRAYCDKSGADINQVHKEEAAMQPLGRIGQVDEVASLAFFLASDEASFITGSAYSIDGGYTAK